MNEYIFGFHDLGGEQNLSGRGWVLITEALGLDPKNVPVRNLTALIDAGITPIIRLNNGYGRVGTIPEPEFYDVFAECCLAYVRASRGAHIFIIGNEPNLSVERPNGMPILPLDYARCFRFCRTMIRSWPGHFKDSVVIAPVGPWNVETAYPGNPSGDWLRYFQDILDACHFGACGNNFGFDGIAIHAYSRGSRPEDVLSDAKMEPPYQDRFASFRTFEDTLAAIPEWAQSVPVYLTEMNQNAPWKDENTGWVQAAYKLLDEWNRGGSHQIVRCGLLYRWTRDDQWYIEGKNGVIADLKAAVRNEYKWANTPYDWRSDEELAERVRSAVWTKCGLGGWEPFYDHPTYALQRKAAQLGLGKPASSEHRLTHRGHTFVWQAYALGIVFTLEGQWDLFEIRAMDWQSLRRAL